MTIPNQANWTEIGSGGMTVTALRDRLIEDGIKSVDRDGRMSDDQKRGSKRGFERCRTLVTPDDFDRVVAELEIECRAFMRSGVREGYWEKRYEQMQVEYVRDVLRVGWGYPTIYASKAMRYAEIVGVIPATQNPN